MVAVKVTLLRQQHRLHCLGRSFALCAHCLQRVVSMVFNMVASLVRLVRAVVLLRYVFYSLVACTFVPVTLVDTNFTLCGYTVLVPVWAVTSIGI
jgi:uncharacterized membrane protein YqjE